MNHPLSEAGTSVEVKPSELAACPFCRSDVMAVGRLFHPSHPATPFQASCGHCGACGSEAATIALAAESWNAVAALIQPTPAETAGVERVWAEITEANHPVAETVLVAYFDETYGEWSIAVKDAPVPTPWTHFLRPGRPDAPPTPAKTEGGDAAAIQALNRQVNQYAWERDKAREERDAAEARSEAFWKAQVSTLSRHLEEAREACARHLEERAVYFETTKGQFDRLDAARSYRASAAEIRRAKETVSHG